MLVTTADAGEVNKTHLMTAIQVIAGVINRAARADYGHKCGLLWEGLASRVRFKPILYGSPRCLLHQALRESSDTVVKITK